jgi:hypothetical protein
MRKPLIAVALAGALFLPATAGASQPDCYLKQADRGKVYSGNGPKGTTGFPDAPTNCDHYYQDSTDNGGAAVIGNGLPPGQAKKQ